MTDPNTLNSHCGVFKLCSCRSSRVYPFCHSVPLRCVANFCFHCCRSGTFASIQMINKIFWLTNLNAELEQRLKGDLQWAVACTSVFWIISSRKPQHYSVVSLALGNLISPKNMLHDMATLDTCGSNKGQVMQVPNTLATLKGVGVCYSFHHING